MLKLLLIPTLVATIGVASTQFAQAGGCHCPCGIQPAPAPADVAPVPPQAAAPAPGSTAQGAETYRSFSAEPAVAAPAAPGIYYGAPARTRSRVAPPSMLPKTDPRKFRVR